MAKGKCILAAPACKNKEEAALVDTATNDISKVEEFVLGGRSS
jgi:hypothetical protein